MPPESIHRWFAGLNRRQKAAGCIWAAALLFCCVKTFVAPQSHNVYPIFANAARKWLAGEDLYRLRPGLDVYRYSPLVTALLTPFGLLPERVGGVIWRLLNAGIYLAALAWFARAAAPFVLSRTQLALLFLLVLPLSLTNLYNGQANTLMLGLLLAGIAGAAAERWNLSAGCIALACLFKIYPIAVGLLLAVVYPRRFAGRFAGALAFGLALPFVLQHPDYVARQYQDLLEHVRSDDRQVLSLDLWLRDLRLLFHVWLVPLTPLAYAAMQVGAGAVMALICWFGRRQGWPSRPLLTLLLALGCCWMTVLGPMAESCTYILLAPSLAVALLHAWHEARPVWVRGLLVGIFTLLLLAQIATWFPGGRWFRNLGPQPLAGLLFLGYLMLDAGMSLFRRAPRQQQTTPIRAQAA